MSIRPVAGNTEHMIRMPTSPVLQSPTVTLQPKAPSPSDPPSGCGSATRHSRVALPRGTRSHAVTPESRRVTGARTYFLCLIVLRLLRSQRSLRRGSRAARLKAAVRLGCTIWPDVISRWFVQSQAVQAGSQVCECLCDVRTTKSPVTHSQSVPPRPVPEQHVTMNKQAWCSGTR